MDNKFIVWIKSSLPVVLLFFGLLIFGIGEVVKFTDSSLKPGQYLSIHWPDYLSDLGKAIFISGVAGIILHTFQFMGIFKEELKKIISHPEYIRNRVDLPQYWETVTRELLKHKFPDINAKIMDDVKNGYLPIDSVNYVEKYWQLTNIKLIDRNKEIVEIEQTTRSTIIFTENKKPFNLEFANTLLGGPGNQYIPTFEICSLIINKVKQEVHVTPTKDGNKHISKYNVTFEGGRTYEMELKIKKTYCLKYDNVIIQINSNIRNNCNLKFQLSGVSLDFNEIGTLKKFKTNADNESLIEKEYVGLIYPRQGYMAIIKKK